MQTFKEAKIFAESYGYKLVLSDSKQYYSVYRIEKNALGHTNIFVGNYTEQGIIDLLYLN